MPLPKVLTSFGASDTTTSRTLANVKSAVDPVLQLLNSTFAVANDNTLAFLRRVKSFAADSVVANSSLVSNGTLFVKGASGFAGGTTTQNGSVVVGGQAITGTQTVNGAQVITGNSSASTMTSGSGFKATFDMGIAWSSSAVVGTRYQTKRYAQNDAAASQFNAPTLFQPIFPGSIIGIHSYSQGTSGGTVTINLYRNQTLVSSGLTPYVTLANTSGAQYSGGYTTFAKGAYPFGVADYFCASANWSVAGNGLTFITLFVEYTA